MATALRLQEHSKQDQIENWIAEAVAARQDFEREGLAYAMLCQRESELEAQRPFVKEEAKRRLMENEPSLSATRADDRVRLDATYVGHLGMQRDVVRERDDAHCRMQSARLRAETALAAVRALAGLI